MPMYAYIARTPENLERQGMIDAPSADAAREELRKQQLRVDDVREVTEKKRADPLPWAATRGALKSPLDVASTATDYVPFTDTLRLFAGWLLAWYGLIYLLGVFQASDRLPIDVPFIEALFTSPLVLRFTFGTFLFLLITSIHRAIGRGALAGVLLSITWLIVMIGFSIFG